MMSRRQRKDLNKNKKMSHQQKTYNHNFHNNNRNYNQGNAFQNNGYNYNNNFNANNEQQFYGDCGGNNNNNGPWLNQQQSGGDGNWNNYNGNNNFSHRNNENRNFSKFRDCQQQSPSPPQLPPLIPNSRLATINRQQKQISNALRNSDNEKAVKDNNTTTNNLKDAANTLEKTQASTVTPAPAATVSMTAPKTTNPPLIRTEDIKKEKMKNLANKSVKEEMMEEQNQKKTKTKSSSSESSSSSSSSNSGSSSSDEDDASKNVKEKQPASKPAKITEVEKPLTKQKSKPTVLKNDEPPPKTKPDEIKKKTKKESAKKKEEDVVCLGKLERKYIIQDDEENNSESEEQNDDEAELKNNKSKDKPKSLEKCMICDKKDHTSFQCQMICKNCSLPYHNLKTCPKPANLNILMQSFMEFCLQQMNTFNPEQRFQLPSNVVFNPQPNILQTPVAVASSAHTVSNEKIRKKGHQKKTKKLLKKKAKLETTDSSSEDSDEIDARESQSANSCDDLASSMTSISNKSKRKRGKSQSGGSELSYNHHLPHAHIPFNVSPYAAAASTHFNPLLYNQMLQGAFPGVFNFSK